MASLKAKRKAAHEEEAQLKAAKIIQAVWRGRLVRKSQQHTRTLALLHSQNTAAVVIQVASTSH